MTDNGTINSISIAEVESHLWESANILRGPVDAADFKTYIAGIKKQPICLPDVVAQDELLSSLRELDEAIESLDSRMEACKSLKKQLLSKIWGT